MRVFFFFFFRFSFWARRCLCFLSEVGTSDWCLKSFSDNFFFFLSVLPLSLRAYVRLCFLTTQVALLSIEEEKKAKTS